MIKRCTNKKKMKNKKYRNLKIFLFKSFFKYLKINNVKKLKSYFKY